MSARVEGMRSPFVLSVLSVLPGSFCRQFFNCFFVADVAVVVYFDAAAPVVVVVWKI